MATGLSNYSIILLYQLLNIRNIQFLAKSSTSTGGALSSLTRFVIFNQVLLISELGVTQAQRKGDKRDTQADTSDGKQPLHMLVRVNHGIALNGADREVEDGGKRLRVGVHSKGLVSEAGEAGSQTGGQDLGPDGARHSIAHGGTDLVQGQVQTCHDSKSLVGNVGLERGLGGVGEHSTRDTEEDLSADDTGLTRAGYDKNFEAAHFVDDKAENRAGDDTREGVEGLNPGGRLDAEVERDLEDGVEIIALHCPGKVEHARDAHGGPDGPVLHVVEGYERVRSAKLPDNEYGDADEADDKRGNNLRGRPLALETTSDGQGNEKQGEDGNEKDNSNNVEKPEEFDGKALETELLEG
ncbi:hypothetical protein HG531_006700 [Fusarium graminearum]|nr:hypothetical protein HG531_006700 [Fusarium graminearum]